MKDGRDLKPLPSSVRISVCNSGHKSVFGLGNVETGSLNYYGLVALDQNRVWSVLGNLSSVVSDYLVKTNVIGALVLADRVNSAHRFVVFKVESDIDIGILARKIENADGLVADEIALLGVAHKTVGNKPYIFSVHNIYPFLAAERCIA